jgi:tetratricopeptide (TPR) repeat protein
VALAGYLLVTGAAATLLGADRAREPLVARERASVALERALEQGNDAPEVTAALVELRTTLSRRPLDSKTRIAYAGLLLGLSRQLRDADVAAFHARRAADLAPATLSVVRPAIAILAHTGRVEDAVALVRSIFAFEPDRAAASLAEIEAHLSALDQALPEEPDAWFAWQELLRSRGRAEESAAWLVRIHERWPEHLRTTERLLADASYRHDWARVAELLPPEPLPDGPLVARILLHRARLHAERGDAELARSDHARALGLDRSSTVLDQAGEISLVLGDHDAARRHWNRALFVVGSGQPALRGLLLAKLARLEDAHGRPAAALRLWRDVLEIDPAHAEARRRADELSGFSGS